MTINIIEYITKNTNIRQKDIADHLAVSRAQISKWKAGEDIPVDRKEELLQLAGLFGDNSEWAMLVKTEENGNAWFEYMKYMNSNESNFLSEKIKEEPSLYIPGIIISLVDAGIPLPDCAPSIEDIETDNYEFSTFDSMIVDLIENYVRLQDWCNMHINSIECEEHNVIEDVMYLDANTSSFAICYLNEAHLRELGVNQSTYKNYCETIRSYVRDSIISLCKAMRNAGIPFMIDYFDYVNKHPHELEDEDLVKSVLGPKSVTDLLPYSERLMFERAKLISELLIELHIKVNTLIAETNGVR